MYRRILEYGSKHNHATSGYGNCGDNISMYLYSSLNEGKRIVIYFQIFEKDYDMQQCWLLLSRVYCV